MKQDAEIRVLFSCTGVGVVNRGIESFFREAFDGLKNTPGVRATLLKGAGPDTPSERRLWNLPRAGRAAQALGRALNRDSYVIEQLSSFAPMIREIRRQRPDVIFYSDNSLGFQLFRWRRLIGVPYTLLFSNGGPCFPPFSRTDHVHQVAPHYLEMALAAGEPSGKHTMVPYGIHVPEGNPDRTSAAISGGRARLNLPVDRKIVISVGWISSGHKRMDYLIREIAALPEPRPFLLMLGLIDEKSQDIIRLAAEALGPQGFSARSVPYDQVFDHYRAADVFALCSLQEGFGRVYLEALMHGLPCAAHDHAVMRYVLGSEGSFRDLSKPGALAEILPGLLAEASDPDLAARRRESVRRRFSWPSLAPAYRQMFFNCVKRSPVYGLAALSPERNS
ncbi:MAG TPA: glycosyltransferase family 4 protein [Bryobacteraceae bacterium]|nr:glycosyltransferase family 4 protein [Bryobacteraceae bacterium]